MSPTGRPPIDRRALITVVAMATVFGVQQGMTFPLLALLLEEAGYSRSIIGLNAAMMAVGVIVAAVYINAVTARFGALATAFAGVVSIIAGLSMLAATDAIGIWFLARFLLGVGINVIFVISETWLNLMVPTATRGRWLAVYASSVGGGFALGPALLLATGTAGAAPFVVATALAAGTGALLFAARTRVPAIVSTADASLKAFLPLAPLLLLAVAGAAAFDQSILTFLPLYALSFGADAAAATLAVSAVVLGNVLLQLPIGWLADRTSRRTAMLTCALAAIAGAGLLPLVGGTGPWFWAMAFVWGGVAYGTYTVALIALGDRFQGALLLAGNAAFALMWGVAGLLGPSTSGIAMDGFGPLGLPLVVGCIFVAISLAFMLPRAGLDRAGSVTQRVFRSD